MADFGKLYSVKNTPEDAVPGRKEQVLCQPCLRKDLQTTADVFCADCDEFQCSECSKAHSVYAFMKNHKLVNASEVKSKPNSFDMKGMDNCDKHGKLLEFFCKDENQLCCSNCAIVDHRKCHSVVEVSEIAEQLRSAGSHLKRKLEKANSQAEMIVKHTQSSKEKLGQDIRAIFVEIQKMRDDANKMFDSLEVYVTRETDVFQAEVTDKLAKKQTSCRKHITDVTTSLDIIDTALQNGTTSQQFIVEQKMGKQVNALCSNVEEECQNLETVTVSFEFDETLKLPPLPISDYIPGKVTLNYSLPEAKKLVAPMKPIKLTKITSIPLKQTGDDDGEPLYSGIDFLSDGRLIAVDNQNKKCLIYNEKLEKLGSYQLPNKPQRVVAVSDEEVAITSAGKYKIDFLHVSKLNEITLNRTYKVTTKYESICLKDERHFVVGTIDDTRPVRIVSLSGEEKDFSVSFPNKKYPLGTSVSTYVRSSDKVVLTDRHEDTVYIYDIATNTRVVVKDDQIKEPLGVAGGPLDIVLVCNANRHSVIQISQTGVVLASYKLDMKYPRSICVSKNQSIVAVTNSCTGKRKLQLFKLSDRV